MLSHSVSVSDFRMSLFSLSTLARSAFLALCLISCGGLAVLGQDAESRIPGVTKPPDPDQPKNMREMQRKMQIDQEKKEYDEMQDRAQQAQKISDDLEKAFSDKPTLTRPELNKLDELEKLVKKIRGELGGG